MTGAPATRAGRWLPAAWAVLLAALLLGPALGPGYVLTYDMVWVPDLALRPDFLGLGTALPRAVPSDAVVAVLDEVVPGMVLQKLLLLGSLVLGAVGAARLAGSSVTARLTTVSVALWSPYVVERLWLGHWPLLLCWAVLPWLVVEAQRFRREGRVGWALPLLLVAGSLSANAGLMSAATALAVGLRRDRRSARLVALVAAANAPWVVSGLLHVGTATSSAAGAVFALGDEGPVPAPVAALSLGGVWNAEVVPSSRTSLLLVGVLTVLLLVLALAGARPLARRLGRRTCWALVGLWVAGYGLAVLSWAAPGLLGWFAETVPAGGLLRDGGRSLALCAPLTAALAGAGAERLAQRWRARAAAALVAVATALLPVAVMPDAAWGISGSLRAVGFPTTWGEARAALGDGDGDLLVLPFTSYRAPAWNGGRKVLDPLPRYLRPDYVVNDRLVVDGRVLAGEDPRVPEVLAALRLPDGSERADALGRLGIGCVVVDRTVPATGASAAPVAGRTVLDRPALAVTVLPGFDAREPSRAARAGMLLAWLAFLGTLLAGAWSGARRCSPRVATRRGRG